MRGHNDGGEVRFHCSARYCVETYYPISNSNSTNFRYFVLFLLFALVGYDSCFVELKNIFFQFIRHNKLSKISFFTEYKN